MLGLVTDQLSSGQPRQQTAARTAAWTAALQHVDHWQVVEVEATVTTSPVQRPALQQSANQSGDHTLPTDFRPDNDGAENCLHLICSFITTPYVVIFKLSAVGRSVTSCDSRKKQKQVIYIGSIISKNSLGGDHKI